MTRHGQGWRLFLSWLLVCQLSSSASAITITIDYTYDSVANGGTNFFGSGNPQGAAGGALATAALDAAAAFYSNILNDSFSAITIHAPYPSSVPGSTGVVTWNWEKRFTHPSGASLVSVLNPTVTANSYRIYAGARPMTGDTAGEGGPGGFNRPSPTVTGTNSFTQTDIDNITAITNALDSAITQRGQPSGFAAWGGAISFDTSSRTWHFNHTTQNTTSTVTDFYSIAIHELAHALGFGEVDGDASHVTPWESKVSGNFFFGSNASALFGGSVPLDTATNRSHWVGSTNSVIFGTTTAQEAAMDPDLTGGTRKLLTELDAAGLKDIGWTVIPLPDVFGDYTDNGIVDAADYVLWRRWFNKTHTLSNDATPGGMVTNADYTQWQRNFGRTPAGGSDDGSTVPEPGGLLLALMAAVGMYLARRKR